MLDEEYVLRLVCRRAPFNSLFEMPALVAPESSDEEYSFQFSI